MCQALTNCLFNKGSHKVQDAVCRDRLPMKSGILVQSSRLRQVRVADNTGTESYRMTYVLKYTYDKLIFEPERASNEDK